MTNSTHKRQGRRDRRKAKASGYAREPGKKAGHHEVIAKYWRGARLPT